MTTFQRARHPEQVEARRTAILGAARAMLAERGVAEISLRELADRIGLAKSNVLRYYDSREAIFLEVLDEEWVGWLDAVEAGLADVPAGDPEGVATVLAATLDGRDLLCELVAAMSAVLERNITIEFARVFKRRAMANHERLAALVRDRLPALGPAGAAFFGGAVFVIIAGLWPYAHPTDVVATVSAELGAPPARESFRANLREGLANQLVGQLARGGAPRPPGEPRIDL
ncbi:TetR/AcrR family transcriptional regulator [Asanoa iriomotensis]|uniref:TetR/AcrR family transcriptional regulator n=1 Tax=Asanoa iriomotensis TaxID=234613 RepID=UPI001EF3A86D|nr:TetR family transcriptional regulator [Asanoa iriomotensis]